MIIQINSRYAGAFLDELNDRFSADAVSGTRNNNYFIFN
jgi:hypothetical protein